MTSDSAAMILTCPDCATSYYVPDNAVGQGGRKVRCATCGFAWKAEPGELDDPLPTPAKRPRKAAAAPETEPEPEEQEYGAFDPYDDEPEPAEEPSADLEHEAEPAEEEAPIFVAPPPKPRTPPSPAVLKALAWSGAAAALVVLGALVLMYRTEVVKLWPAAAGAYARVGLPVNAVGLTLQEVSARRQVLGGHPVWVVSGEVRNIRDQPVQPPPLSITLFDKSGKVLARKTATGTAAPLASGDARSFSLSLVDPPPTASELEVSFDVGERPARVSLTP